jgi:hypothetical protein
MTALPARLFFRAAGIKRQDDGENQGNSKQGRNADLQGAAKGGCLSLHFLGYRNGLKCRVCNFLAFFRKMSGLLQAIQFLFGPQLPAHASQQFRAIPRQRNYIIGSKVQTLASLRGPAVNQQNHADVRGGGGSLHFPHDVAARRIGRLPHLKNQAEFSFLHDFRSFR